MGVRTLADELPSLVDVEAWVPRTREALAQLRYRARSTLSSIALANGASPDHALIAACEAACDALAKQLEEAAALAATVRAYVDTRPSDDPSFSLPMAVRNAWGKMTVTKLCAVDDLARLRDQLDS